MAIIKPAGPDPSLFRYAIQDGYEQGGLLYFRFEGREMVAIIRDRSEFDKHLKLGTQLQGYVNTLVSDKAYGAALEIEKLIPEKPV
jgi:hypothetical protein